MTSGPAGGKTTSIPLIKQHLENKNYTVLIVPEIPTLLSECGLNIQNAYKANTYAFETKIIELQLNLENTFNSLANRENNVVILCDRGLLDHKAYLESEMWYNILTKLGINTPEYRNGVWYDLVLHLTSVAVDFPDLFTTANNKAREGCTVEIAREYDIKLKDAWKDHHNRVIIPNLASLEAKRNKIIEEIDKYLEKANETKN